MKSVCDPSEQTPLKGFNDQAQRPKNWKVLVGKSFSLFEQKNSKFSAAN